MTQTSKEYANALFMLAAENHEEYETLCALKTASQVFAENPEYIDFLQYPGIAKKERIEALGKAFDGMTPEYALSFMKLLCEHSHMNIFDDCLHEYEEMYNVSKRICMAVVTSAVELTDEEKERLRLKLHKLSGKTPVFRYVVDKNILGGIIVEADGKIMDGSLRRRLKEVKEVIDR